MSGHGELAVIHTRQLYLVGGPVTGVKYVGFGNNPNDPQWSHDGRWLSVVVTPPPYKAHPFRERPSQVWIVTPRGRPVLLAGPTDVDTYDVSVAWSPAADRLAISYTTHGQPAARNRVHLDLVTLPARGSQVFAVQRTPLLSAAEISGFAWSPNGLQIAVGSDRFGGAPGVWRSKLVAIDAESFFRHTITTATGNVLEVAGWWPDGSGVLTWLDHQGSASLAADGLPLYDITVANGHRRKLASSMLQYSQWLATSAVRDEVAFIAGGDRDVTLGHKHLVVCDRRECHVQSQGRAQVSFDPAWSAEGTLAFVRDQAIDPNHGCCGLAYVNKIQESGGVLVLPHGRAPHAAQAGDAASAPTWGTDGSMLVVKNDALWLLSPGLQQATKVVDGLQVLPDSNYYGNVAWHDSFAWTDAVAG